MMLNVIKKRNVSKKNWAQPLQETQTHIHKTQSLTDFRQQLTESNPEALDQTVLLWWQWTTSATRDDDTTTKQSHIFRGSQVQLIIEPLCAHRASIRCLLIGRSKHTQLVTDKNTCRSVTPIQLQFSRIGQEHTERKHHRCTDATTK